MVIQRIGLGGLVLGVGGLLLFIDMFLPWFGYDLLYSDEETFNAWESLGFIDIVVFLTALGALAVPITRWLGKRWSAISLVTVGLAALALLLCFIRLLDPVSDYATVGLILALLLIAAIIAGGVLALRDEGTSLGDQATKIAQQAQAASAQAGNYPQQGQQGQQPGPPGQPGQPGQPGPGQPGGFGPPPQPPPGGFGGAPQAPPGGFGGAPQAPPGGFGPTPPPQPAGPGPTPPAQPAGPGPTPPAQPAGPGPAPRPEPAEGGPPPPDPGTAATPAAGPPANWYPDPYGEKRLRYWDGSAWTDRSAD